MESEAQQTAEREQAGDAEDSSRPKLRWFQLHRLTILVLILMAAVLLWANRRRKYQAETDGKIIAVEQHGWPWSAGLSVFVLEDANSDNLNLSGYASFSYEKMGRNVAVALISLFAVGFICEWMIGRKLAKPRPRVGDAK
jgi:hypothetical protein